MEKTKNFVTVRGSLTKAPELRTLADGKTVVTDVTVAINNTYTNKDGQDVKETSYIDVTAFNETANELKRISDTVKSEKGKNAWLEIKGPLKQERWEKDGKKNSKVKIFALSVKEGSRAIEENRENDKKSPANAISIEGNLVKDAEFTTLPSGDTVARTAIAVNNDYTVNGKVIKQDPSFFDIEAFNETAEFLKQNENGKKGAHLEVKGKIKQDRWQKDGKNFSRIKIIPFEILKKTIERSEKKEQSQQVDFSYSR